MVERPAPRRPRYSDPKSDMIQQGVGSGLTVIEISRGGYAAGGNFIADRPGFIQVGERGAERVTVEPLTGANAGRFVSSGGGETINLSLNVNGSLAGMSRTEIKNIVKAAYMEVVTKGNSVRRVNASQARRGL